MAELINSEPTPHRDPSSRTLVLLVDDNVGAAESLSLLIEMWGHECRVAHHGVGALRLAGELTPDVVLLDINLPDMDGYAVARMLRGDVRLRHSRFYAVTGYLDEDEGRLVGSSIFDQVLIKPIDLTRLEQELAAIALRSGSDGEGSFLGRNDGRLTG